MIVALVIVLCGFLMVTWQNNFQKFRMLDDIGVPQTFSIFSLFQGRKEEGGVSLYVKADSLGRNIAGFDLIVRYDPRQVKMLTYTASSGIADVFDLYDYQKKGKMILTGVKKVSYKGEISFTGTYLIKLIAIPLVDKPVKVEIVPVLGKDKTKMVDDRSQQILLDSNKSVIINLKP